MAESSRPAASAARYGFTDKQAQDVLRGIGWWRANGPDPTATPMLAALARVPDPNLALLTLDRVRTADERSWTELSNALRTDSRLRARLLAVLGTSTALGDLVVNDPEQWHRLAYSSLTPMGDYEACLTEAVLSDDVVSTGTVAIGSLRAAYRGLLLEIAAADLAPVVDPHLDKPLLTDTTRALTRLAEAALRTGLLIAQAQTGCGADGTLAIIAMGKCGGRELNYVSDVDVVFVGGDDIPAATRLATTVMDIVGRACFVVDAALRPEGAAGALVRSLDSHESYYTRWARTWEFQALLKARPVAGDNGLGGRYAELVAPLVWSAAEREDFVVDVQRMRRRVERHVPDQIADRELKLGRGGLRDIEFAVQLLQLVHGRADATLRSPSTVDALEALGAGGYVGRVDAAELRESYAFLREVEHRLQLRGLRRTHLFPERDDAEQLRWLARACGIRSVKGKPESEVLTAEFRRHARRVRRLHEKLFYRPLLEAVSKVPMAALRLTTQQATNRLGALGYLAPDVALRHIRALTEGVSRRAAIQQTLLPVLLDLLADTPDADGGLLAYRRVSEALADTTWYLRVLRDEAAVVENLATLLGTARLIPDLLVRAPEVLRLLGNPSSLLGRPPAEVARSLRTAAGRHPTMDATVVTARSLRRHELLRVACADLLGLLDVSAVCVALSSVWTAVLQASLSAAIRQRAVEAGGERARIAVIGMGRLGGEELGYGSDADVLFVCEPVDDATDAEAVRYATSVVELMRRELAAPSQDPPLEVDTGLRPEGRNGPLVRTLESYRNYYARRAQVWEAQALLRARTVAGDSELGERFLTMVESVRYPENGLSSAQVREIRRIKARVETERLPRGADPAIHPKLGRGGLADVEWTAQLWQLRYAHAFPELRTTSTPGALGALVRVGLVDAVDAAALTDAWELATRARNVTMLVKGKQTEQLSTSGRALSATAYAFGASVDDDPGEFLDNYRRVTRRAHDVVQRLFYES